MSLSLQTRFLGTKYHRRAVVAGVPPRIRWDSLQLTDCIDTGSSSDCFSCFINVLIVHKLNLFIAVLVVFQRYWFTLFAAVWCKDIVPHVCIHKLIILSSRIWNWIRSADFFHESGRNRLLTRYWDPQQHYLRAIHFTTCTGICLEKCAALKQ